MADYENRVEHLAVQNTFAESKQELTPIPRRDRVSCCLHEGGRAGVQQGRGVGCKAPFVDIGKEPIALHGSDIKWARTDGMGTINSYFHICSAKLSDKFN